MLFCGEVERGGKANISRGFDIPYTREHKAAVDVVVLSIRHNMGVEVDVKFFEYFVDVERGSRGVQVLSKWTASGLSPI